MLNGIVVVQCPRLVSLVELDREFEGGVISIEVIYCLKHRIMHRVRLKFNAMHGRIESRPEF